MKLSGKHLFILKISGIVALSIAGAALFVKGLYFSAILVLILIILLATSLYNSRRKLIEKMERMIAGIRYSDFSFHFADNQSKDELGRLSKEMEDALQIFRDRTHDSLMDEAETQAWQKLITVLTHEIMNSIAPIISLSETIAERAANGMPSEEEYRLMKRAMETIHRRSKGLLSFVQNYRQLTRIPDPVKQPIDILSLLKHLQQLVSANGIRFAYTSYPERLIVVADRNMLEQMLINLLKNASEATVSQVSPLITVKAEQVGNIVQVTVFDNGSGIAPQALDKIFIPFYTTKQGGSGIGLSLTRQMMIRHKGTISVKSDETGSAFTLSFPG